MEKANLIELKIETYSRSESAEWENTVIIDPKFYVDCDDIVITIENKYRITDTQHNLFSETLQTQGEAEISINKEQAKTIVNFLSQFI